jgi:hypothetical protein
MSAVIFAAWWDMLSDPCRNPPTWDSRCGQDDGLEQRLGDMLLHRVVHAGHGDRESAAGAHSCPPPASRGRRGPIRARRLRRYLSA